MLLCLSVASDTREALDDAHRAIDALAAERAAADARARIVQSGREEIISAPAEDDAPIAPVLDRALSAADEIGGIDENFRFCNGAHDAFRVFDDVDTPATAFVR